MISSSHPVPRFLRQIAGVLSVCVLVAVARGADRPAAAPADPDEGATAKTKSPAEKIVILRMRDGLRFDPPRFAAQPGESLILQIENADGTGLTHNFLLLKPGRREEIVNAALALGEKGQAQNFIPANDDVLLAMPLLAVDGVSTLHLKLPAEPGIYPYVCTFPGHGMIMYGAAYVGVPEPKLSADKNIPVTAVQTAVPGAGRRPFVQRIFMPDCGPAAIAVALAGNQNFCWDAGECRLRYAWQGDFIDAAEHWDGKGGQLGKVPAQPWWQAERGGRALRVDARRGEISPAKFLGYGLTPRGPEFHYRVGGTEVFEQILPASGGPGLAIHFRIPAASGEVFYDIPPEEKDRWHSSTGSWDGPTLHLTAVQAREFSLTFTTPLCRP